MQYIKLELSGSHGKGVYTLIDTEDISLVSPYRWWFQKNTGYVVGKKSGKRKEKIVLMHKLILNPPNGFITDHINGNRLDNRRHNLRLATPAQNQWNSRPYGASSQYKGVIWEKSCNRWRARIMYNNKHYHLGVFKSEKLAALAYNQKAKEFFGEYAYLNKVLE